jgi:ABC-type polysaccharide/polyol phosphate export permease
MMMAMTMLIHDDRSRNEVLKHIYLTPGSLTGYILGRALNGVMNASISLLLALSLALGIICFIGMGFILCDMNILTSRVHFTLNEYVSGILHLFGGAIFMPEVLPVWGRTISNGLPITYFLRAIRFSILQQSPTPIQTDLLYLVITMIATMIIGIVSFRLVAHKARKDGLIDKKEEY